MSLAAATRSELTKQFTTSAWWVLGIVTVAYLGMNAGGVAALIGADAKGLLSNASGPSPFGPPETAAPLVYSLATATGFVFPLLIGTLIVTSEFRHHLLVPTFLATPRRASVLVAKMLTGVVMGALTGAFALLATFGLGAGILAAFGVDTQIGSADTWAMLGRILLAFVLWTLIGVGIGSLVRNQVAAVIVVVVFALFVEPLLRAAGGIVESLKTVSEYLPSAASDTLVGSSLMSAAFGASGGPAWWVGGLTLAAYALVFVVLGAVTTWRRDVN